MRTCAKFSRERKSSAEGMNSYLTTVALILILAHHPHVKGFQQQVLQQPKLAPPLQMLALFESPEPMTTTHVRLGQIYSKTRDYLFSITKNVRFYEWTRDEVETLYSDLTESMRSNPNIDYELNQCLAVRSSDAVYEVADGQQRLITLCLLLAALRDSLSDEKHGMAVDIQDGLVVKSYGQEDAFRVVLRKKHNSVLQDILLGNPVAHIDGTRNPVEDLIAQNYWALRSAVEADAAKDPDFQDTFFRYLWQQVYIYLTIPQDQSIARKLVGVSRRGKDTEPIDEFKSLVVFLGIESQTEQDIILEEWVTLQDEVGREVFEDACMLMAQGQLSQRAKRHGAVDLLESFWKTWPGDGRSFFRQVIRPGVLRWSKFQCGESNDSAKWTFLRNIAARRSGVDIAVYEALDSQPDDQALSVLERVALLLAITSVPITRRHERSFGICQALRRGEPLDEYDLSVEESEQVMQALDVTEFGATGPRRKIAAAILSRADAELGSSSHGTVEHVLPLRPPIDSSWTEEWSLEERLRWRNRLGNLCLVNVSNTKRNRDFMEKKTLYKQTNFPVTLRVCKFDQWQQPEVEIQHRWMLDHCQTLFGLAGAKQRVNGLVG